VTAAQVIETAVRMSRKRVRATAEPASPVRVLFITSAAAPALKEEEEEGSTHVAVADAAAATQHTPRWLWKRAGVSDVTTTAADAAPLPIMPGGLFSSSPRRGTPERVIEMRVEHASAKKARLLTATSNTLKGIVAGRVARVRSARLRRLERAASKRHALRKSMLSAESRRAALLAGKLAAVHAHLESVKAKAALVRAARASAAVAATAVAC
jgi:hypothetical protein